MDPYNLYVILIDKEVKPFYMISDEALFDVEKELWYWASMKYDELRLSDNDDTLGFRHYHPEQFVDLIIERAQK